MDKTNKIMEQLSNCSVKLMTAKAVAMILFIAAAILIMSACQRKPVMAHSSFTHLPSEGWQRSLPLTYIPVYDDSAAVYDVTLVVRHANSYRYRNLSLVVDIIDADSAVTRREVNMLLADEYGNWSGGGFGALYQDQTVIAHSIAPDDAHTIVVWQSMQSCDTLRGLEDLGVIVRPK